MSGKHAQDVRDAIELGALLGVKRVVTMSGLPGTDASATLPAWTVLPWDSSYLDARDHHWNEVAVPFWRDIQAAELVVGLRGRRPWARRRVLAVRPIGNGA